KCSLEQMNDYTKRSFLTVKTGIDLIGERSGFFPTYKWYVENYGKYVGIIGPKVNISIGQGEILVTPLQMCFYFNAIANNGKWIQPHILEKEIGEKRTILYSGITKNLPISTKNLEMIQESLYKAVNERYGTGVAASFPDIEVYGKTGSAENHMGKKTHAWFAGYVKWDKPEIAFVVFMENAGHGGSVAAPLAAKFIKYYDKMRIE
ncbi:MAG: penicillin-binding protein 2, partial [Candidatus Cloacimonetes bacterium]|nr:penicillin-binding protein 2 [Candidatus Cloacimonadota bacterium]